MIHSAFRSMLQARVRRASWAALLFGFALATGGGKCFPTGRTGNGAVCSQATEARAASGDCCGGLTCCDTCVDLSSNNSN